MGHYSSQVGILIYSLPLCPYGTIGVGLNGLTVENGGFDAGGQTDTSYFGYSFFYGGGIAYFIIPQCSINAGFGYRATSFSTVEGHDITDGLKASGANYTIGVSYVF